MIGNMFKVIRDHKPSRFNRDKELLSAEKGDILVDCEMIDEKWFRGKNMISEKIGKIPTSHVSAFSSNDQNDTYEDMDDFSSPDASEKTLIKGDDQKNPVAELITNPLLHAVEYSCYEDCNDPTDTGTLSKYCEENYAEISSAEDINDDEEKPELCIQQVKPSHKPAPNIRDIAKYSDDGYNSGSHYSGENNESSIPLLHKVNTSRQDEAGYEVPNILFDFKERQTAGDIGKNAPVIDKKKETKFMKFRRKTLENSEPIDRASEKEADREKFYNPPVDFRDFYFLPLSSFTAIRILLSFILALGLALGLFLGLYILVKFHSLLCFSLAAVVFICILIGASTLLNRGMLCVFCLLVPSLASTRAKQAVIITLCVLLICGPILGAVDKFSFSTDCERNENTDPTQQHRMRRASLRFPVEGECKLHLRRVNDYCAREWRTFRENCERYLSENMLNKEEARLCRTDLTTFCSNETIIENFCTVHLKTGMIGYQSNFSFFEEDNRMYGHKKQNDIVRLILLYLLPLLFLLIASDAYVYNRVYLCTKNTDNIYITQRLRDLDCERKNRGLTDLIFPLTRIEFQTYLLRSTFSWSKLEKINAAKWLFVFLVSALVTIGLVVLENNVHIVLLVVLSDKCKKIYELQSEHSFRVIIYSLNGVLLFLIFVQSHVLRARNVICEFFYPDMIDIRSKHLYYKILHDRHTFSRHIRRKIQLLAEDKRMSCRISFKSKCYAVLPKRLQWFCRKLTVRVCMICDSLCFHKTIECEEPNCQAHYCFECYVDAGQHCLTCNSHTVNNDRAMSIAI